MRPPHTCPPPVPLAWLTALPPGLSLRAHVPPQPESPAGAPAPQHHLGQAPRISVPQTQPPPPSKQREPPTLLATCCQARPLLQASASPPTWVRHPHPSPAIPCSPLPPLLHRKAPHMPALWRAGGALLSTQGQNPRRGPGLPVSLTRWGAGAFLTYACSPQLLTAYADVSALCLQRSPNSSRPPSLRPQDSTEKPVGRWASAWTWTPPHRQVRSSGLSFLL